MKAGFEPGDLFDLSDPADQQAYEKLCKEGPKENKPGNPEDYYDLSNPEDRQLYKELHPEFTHFRV